ncbi:MAG: hypothetical protein CL760_10660 [Chloroflexi bacterium]|nr:hypothetical protein [Chloroflexota bacterium]|tara:strand:- start:48803 stop:49471 length:669 start_codon:yes stop_codon:yes gene_type:complete
MKKNKGFLSIKQILKVFEREAYNSFHTYSRVLSYSNPEEYKSNVEYLEYYLKSKDNVLLNVYDFNTIEKENFIGLIDKMHYLKNLKKEYYDYPLIEDFLSSKKYQDFKEMKNDTLFQVFVDIVFKTEKTNKEEGEKYKNKHKELTERNFLYQTFIIKNRNFDEEEKLEIMFMEKFIRESRKKGVSLILMNYDKEDKFLKSEEYMFMNDIRIRSGRKTRLCKF